MKASSGRSLKAAIILSVGAAGLVWLYLTGVEIGSATTRATIIAAIWGHVGYGVILTPLLLPYALWRLFTKNLQFSDVSLIGRSQKIVGWILIASIIFLLISGPLVVWTHGFPLKVFDWFAISNPIGKHEVLHDNLETAHVMIATALPFALTLDVLMLAIRAAARRHKH